MGHIQGVLGGAVVPLALLLPAKRRPTSHRLPLYMNCALLDPKVSTKKWKVYVFHKKNQPRPGMVFLWINLTKGIRVRLGQAKGVFKGKLCTLWAQKHINSTCFVLLEVGRVTLGQLKKDEKKHEVFLEFSFLRRCLWWQPGAPVWPIEPGNCSENAKVSVILCLFHVQTGSRGERDVQKFCEFENVGWFCPVSKKH